jgi:parallel beta-helix repeat protein
VKSNSVGFEICGASDCYVHDNDIVNNQYGINLTLGSNNRIAHNSFVGSSTAQAISDGHSRAWDNGYPDGGNFWDNHTTLDSYNGPYQNETGGDGIVDIPYIINGFNRDRYPLTKPFDEFVHDVAVSDVTPTEAQVDSGRTTDISTTVENLGNIVETFNITVYYDGRIAAMQTVPYLLPGVTKGAIVQWNTIGSNPGTYSLKAEASQVAGETVIANNVYINGSVEIRPAHDVAPLGITPSKVIVGPKGTVTFNVTVINKGTFNESFNATLYADKNTTIIGDEITIGTTRIDPLANATSTMVTFTWNTTGVLYGNYTISAYTTPVDGETYTVDNTFVDGIVRVAAMQGDVNGDGKVNMIDLYTIALHYGANAGEPNYLESCDIDSNGKINMLDLYIAALNFGKTEP